MEKIKVLIADNSGFVRLVMSDILNRETDIEVVDTALNGEQLLVKTHICKPDVIIVDIELPDNYNLFVLKRIMHQTMAGIIISGSEERLNGDLVQELRRLGVKNFLIKPENVLRPQLRNVEKEIVKKVRITAGRLKENMPFADVMKRGLIAIERCRITAEKSVETRDEMQVIVIGASTGGPAVIETILSGFDASFPGVFLIAQHIPSSFTTNFVSRLKRATNMEVVEGEKNMKLLPGRVIIAPGNRNMIVKPAVRKATKAVIDFAPDNAIQLDTPSVDLLMQSVAQIYGKDVLGVILSGLGRDGTIGAGAIKVYGGEVIVQNQESAAAFSMARSAIEGGFVRKVLPPVSIARYISRFIQLSSLRIENSVNII